jgi:hypothetical protein
MPFRHNDNQPPKFIIPCQCEALRLTALAPAPVFSFLLVAARLIRVAACSAVLSRCFILLLNRVAACSQMCLSLLVLSVSLLALSSQPCCLCFIVLLSRFAVCSCSAFCCCGLSHPCRSPQPKK